MDKLAKKILKQAEPALEKLVDSETKISEKELCAAEMMVRIAHDLIECDVMMDKMPKGWGDEGDMPDYEPDRANDELMGAEEYVRMYSETGDKDYLTMAHDETTHAEKFIAVMPDGERKREYMTRYDNLAMRIKKYGMAV